MLAFDRLLVVLGAAGVVLLGTPAALGAARVAPGPTPARSGPSPAALPPAPATRGAPSGATSWQAPLGGPLVVTRRFEPPATRYGAGHRGVDLAGPVGSPTLAAGDGVVGFAGVLAGRGVVTVVHGALKTTYEPVVPVVHDGQAVHGGDVLATLAGGHPGCPAAACLHWGLLRGDVYLDPLSLLHRAPSRLLPLPPAGAPAAPPHAVMATPAHAPGPASPGLAAGAAAVGTGVVVVGAAAIPAARRRWGGLRRLMSR